MNSESPGPIHVIAEVDSLEELLRGAVVNLDGAAAAANYIEREGGPDWSGNLPSAMEIEDLAQRTRRMVHRIIDLQGRITAEDE